MTNRHDQESGEVVHRICADARPAALEPGSLELRPADRLRALALLGEVCSTCLTANWCQSPIRGTNLGVGTRVFKDHGGAGGVTAVGPAPPPDRRTRPLTNNRRITNAAQSFRAGRETDALSPFSGLAARMLHSRKGGTSDAGPPKGHVSSAGCPPRVSPAPSHPLECADLTSLRVHGHSSQSGCIADSAGVGASCQSVAGAGSALNEATR